MKKDFDKLSNKEQNALTKTIELSKYLSNNVKDCYNNGIADFFYVFNREFVWLLTDTKECIVWVDTCKEMTKKEYIEFKQLFFEE